MTDDDDDDVDLEPEDNSLVVLVVVVVETEGNIARRTTEKLNVPRQSDTRGILRAYGVYQPYRTAQSQKGPERVEQKKKQNTIRKNAKTRFVIFMVSVMVSFSSL